MKSLKYKNKKHYFENYLKFIRLYHIQQKTKYEPSIYNSYESASY